MPNQVTESSKHSGSLWESEKKENAGVPPHPGTGRFMLSHGGKKPMPTMGLKETLAFLNQNVTGSFLSFLYQHQRELDRTRLQGGSHHLRFRGSRLSQGTHRARGPRGHSLQFADPPAPRDIVQAPADTVAAVNSLSVKTESGNLKGHSF